MLSFITLDTEEEKLSIYNCTLGSELGHWGGRLTCSYQTLAKHHSVMILLYGHNSRQWSMVHSSFYQFLTVFTSHSLDVFTDNKITQEQYTIIKSHHTKKSDNSLDLFYSASLIQVVALIWNTYYAVIHRLWDLHVLRTKFGSILSLNSNSKKW